MKRRTAKANNAFLLGSIIMIVLVLVIVVLFLFFSFKLYEKKENPYANDRYEIVLSASSVGSPLTIYMNDSLLFDGTPQSSLTLSVGRFADQSSLLIVDGKTDLVSTIELSEHSETVHIAKNKDGYFRERMEP